MNTVKLSKGAALVETVIQVYIKHNRRADAETLFQAVKRGVKAELAHKYKVQSPPTKFADGEYEKFAAEVVTAMVNTTQL